MKKKNSQLTFLHCYHHGFMVLGCYIAVRWLPGGHGLLLGLINLFVHGIMYFYYFLTSFKPELKQSLWWKKHITQFQMVKKRKHLAELFQIISIFSVPICYFGCLFPARLFR
jgi:elongation of very long chain fatty acids protein 7